MKITKKRQLIISLPMPINALYKQKTLNTVFFLFLIPTIPLLSFYHVNTVNQATFYQMMKRNVPYKIRVNKDNNLYYYSIKLIILFVEKQFKTAYIIEILMEIALNVIKYRMDISE